VVIPQDSFEFVHDESVADIRNQTLGVGLELFVALVSNIAHTCDASSFSFKLQASLPTMEPHWHIFELIASYTS
jgi:hypothetical protein